MAERLEKFTTPKGIAMFPWLTRPDTKWDVNGVYKISLSIPNTDPDAIALSERIRDRFVEEYGTKKLAKANFPFKDDGEGNLVFSFKSKKPPRLFNAKGSPIKATEDLKVGGGSEVKVNGSMAVYDKGINTGVVLYLNAVQIIELVEFGNKSLFDDEGGSFTETFDESEDPNPKKKAKADEEDEEGSEF
jgi:hypothetical protein